MHPFDIRDERDQDAAAIEAVTRAAFGTVAYSSGTEQFIVRALREAGCLSVSLVATEDGVVVGHAGASPVEISGGAAGWHGMGPVSVAPGHQGRGIGTRLVVHVLDALRTAGSAPAAWSSASRPSTGASGSARCPDWCCRTSRRSTSRPCPSATTCQPAPSPTTRRSRPQAECPGAVGRGAMPVAARMAGSRLKPLLRGAAGGGGWVGERARVLDQGEEQLAGFLGEDLVGRVLEPLEVLVGGLHRVEPLARDG